MSTTNARSKLSRRDLLKLAAGSGLLLPPLGLTACGEGDDARSLGASETSSTSSVATAARQQSVRARSERTVHFAFGETIPSLDPQRFISFADWQITGNLAAGLTRLTLEGGTTPSENLATSWQSSSDLRCWTFTLRDDIAFSNGVPITAQKVVSSFRRALDPKTGFFYASVMPPVDKITALDSKTVQFSLITPSVSLPTILVAFGIVDTDTLSEINHNPACSGPFKVVEFEPDNYASLVPNERYWGPPPDVTGVRAVISRDGSPTFTALRAGTFDAAMYYDAQDMVHLASSDSQYTILDSLYKPQIHMWIVDCSSPPFDQIEARQALAYATDRAALSEFVFPKLVGVSPENNDIFPQGTEEYNPDLRSYPYDLDKAKELFESVGVSRLTWWGESGLGLSTQAEILQSSLKKIGITLDIQLAEISEWANRFYPKTEPPKRYPGLVVGPSEGSGFPGFLLFRRIQPKTHSGNWHNPEFQALIDRADREADETTRTRLYRQAQRIFNEEVPQVIAGLNQPPVIIRRDITGVFLDAKGILHLESLSVTS